MSECLTSDFSRKHDLCSFTMFNKLLKIKSSNTYAHRMNCLRHVNILLINTVYFSCWGLQQLPGFGGFGTSGVGVPLVGSLSGLGFVSSACTWASGTRLGRASGPLCLPGVSPWLGGKALLVPPVSSSAVQGPLALCWVLTGVARRWVGGSPYPGFLPPSVWWVSGPGWGKGTLSPLCPCGSSV